jgi:hypothetical protein
MSFDEYYHLAVARARPAVEAFTGAMWEVPDCDTALEQTFRSDRELFSSRKFPSVEFYRYMVYLRHHGFPSPLLDWTSSMHVAAFFAFRETGTDKRSIFVYCERPYGIKDGALANLRCTRSENMFARMRGTSGDTRTTRSVLLSTRDLVAGAFIDMIQSFGAAANKIIYGSFDLPSTERIAILKSLDQYNLNAFSLFDSRRPYSKPCGCVSRFWKRGCPKCI